MTQFEQDEVFSPVDTQPTVPSRLKELNASLPAGVNFHLESVFPKTTGWGWKKSFKTKLKYIENTKEILQESLLEGEEVLYISKGTRYSFLEFYFMGLWAAMINHTVFVLTNLRLVMIHSNSKGKPKKTLWMIYYSQIDKFKGTWNGMLNLKLKDGKKLSFTGFPKADRKTMPVIFQEALDRYRESGFNPGSSQSLENLCTHCKDKVPKNEHDCDNCGATYWKPSELAWRSFIFPSWGDFLMGHTTIAFLEMFGGIMTWSAFVVLIVSGIQTNKPEDIIAAFFVIGIAHGIDAAITAHIAGKGLHPKKGPSQFETETAA
ncbi:hypothetical protein [Rubinisphaera sp.]|uniref:hypothetical protein n=1 Tax=Rubinisphaera sp. TaxID=2024857 RepID=UPI000C0ED4B0|nr:hypothetical protein [Rubinisphaera sp.]MBV12121.1 hypothetical protein [Rubinisphaera sp.]HCS55870.1 hypothetical protein [Planctomycetaceae bacterium]|tara:strand:+ start:1769 stop:2725 length:957 start_codon:yes stop_codon:yes gene_type:complete